MRGIKKVTGKGVKKKVKKVRGKRVTLADTTGGVKRIRKAFRSATQARDEK